ncbi:hypothetical protein PAXINDRAFT_20106 [Paxillus involutus ATCC 200175]|uniref:Uncharacterized protein n=1 Tax=Paxillus involutus ATCC 200175 TaxID=664439 RepID=A0A0C9TEY6_PAXIN|nr:hypothetical protein PAXINDRAFT_20106 [Paxillus involutus ATCC 200175]
MVSQTAVVETTDATNPNAMSVGPATPVGRSYGLLNESDKDLRGRSGKVDEGVEVENEKGEWASGIKDPSLNDDDGNEDIHHAYIIPNTTQLVPYHAELPPDPPSMPLEGEKNGQLSSGHIDKMAMHLEPPGYELTTMQQEQTPHNGRSNREG